MTKNNTKSLSLLEASLYHTINKDRQNLHVSRKLWHCLTGLTFIYLHTQLRNPRIALGIVTALLFIDVTFELLRLKNTYINGIIIRYFKPFMRAHEIKTMSTIPQYLLATVIAFAVFPHDVATLSILFLACGDPIASLFGIQWGHLSFKITASRSLIGTLAGVTTCALISFFFYSTLPFSARIAMTLVGGLAGGLAELAPIDMDDNFTIPIISGFSLWLAAILLAS
jgi:dolichol kinase